MNWLDELNQALRKEAEPVPKGWLSLEQECKRTGLSQTRLKEKLSDALRLEILERKKFRVHTGKAFRWVYHYRKL